MAVVNEISDGGQDPNTPTVEQMRKSQRVGSVGKGTARVDFGEMQGCFNLGTGAEEYPFNDESFDPTVDTKPR